MPPSSSKKPKYSYLMMTEAYNDVITKENLLSNNQQEIMAFQNQPCGADWQMEKAKMFTVDVIQCLLEYKKKFCPSIVFQDGRS
ncbi:hypothetical protein DPMN_172827 [Dreissena polymorpha]|uniref:Uncharacterized protein n=1 Tax=Dreissena polymorpha TaxID=45954 RepID=A0A9D4E300_DREPO|nr:hypothetical protein DPMN_172827 [Dreissena polymorpha]